MVARGLLWTSLESFALSGLSLISLVVFARYLSAEEFGVAALSLAIVQVLTLPVEMLFHDAIIQRKDLEPAQVNSAFTISVVLGFTLCGGCWLGSDLIAQVMHEPKLGEPLKWMSLSLLGMGFGSVLVATQRRKLEFRALALRSLSGRAGSAVIAIAVAVQGGGVWSLVVQQVLLVCLGTLTLWMMSDDRPRFGFAWQKTRSLLHYGFFSMLHHLMVIVVPRSFMLLVGGYLGSKIVGILSLAFRGLDMLRDLVCAALWQVAMPAFSQLQEKRDALFTAYTRSLQLTTLVTYPVFVGLAVCADETLLLVFGPEWAEAGPYFVLISLLTLPFFLRFYASALLNAIGKPGAPVAEFLAQALFVLVGMLIIGRVSAWHAMAVWALRLLVSIPVDMWILKRASGMSYRRQLQGPLIPFVASVVMGGLVLLAKTSFLLPLEPRLRLVPMVLIGAVSYVASIVVLDRELIRQFLTFARQSLNRGSA